MVNVNILLTFAECLGCIWRFRVSFLCTATSARYLDTYVRRFASQSTPFPPSHALNTDSFKQSNKFNFVRSKSGCEQERGGGGGVSEQNLHFRRSVWCKKGLLACACPGRRGSTVMEDSYHHHQCDISSLLFFGS